MALPNARGDREYQKFSETDSGNVAVRIKIEDAIDLEQNSTFTIKDHRGFEIFKIDEKTGNVYIKGTVEKLK
jgi:hypothetical protein